MVQFEGTVVLGTTAYCRAGRQVISALLAPWGRNAVAQWVARVTSMCQVLGWNPGQGRDCSGTIARPSVTSLALLEVKCILYFSMFTADLTQNICLDGI